MIMKMTKCWCTLKYVISEGLKCRHSNIMTVFMQYFQTFSRQLMTQILEWKMFIWQQNMLLMKLWANKWHKWHITPKSFFKSHYLTSDMKWAWRECMGIAIYTGTEKKMSPQSNCMEREERPPFFILSRKQWTSLTVSHTSCGQVQHHLWGRLNYGTFRIKCFNGHIIIYYAKF